MKTIGALGGIGPQAMMDFVARVHRVSQQRIPQLAISGYPPLVVFYFREAPVLLTNDGKPVPPLRPNPRFS
jgi:aspartate/glutamate racemase